MLNRSKVIHSILEITNSATTKEEMVLKLNDLIISLEEIISTHKATEISLLLKDDISYKVMTKICRRF